ncbi:MAG: peptide chain release factor 1 [Bacillota bacterium]|nr:peptide chain release factor 1 [Bacillota bacterium]
MFDKLEFIEKQYQDLNLKISDPKIIANQTKFQMYLKEHAEIRLIVEKYREYKIVKEGINEAKEILKESNDKEFKELAKMELEENLDKMEIVEEELKMLLLPKDPNDDKNVILEVRAGAGGDEAGLFAAELLKMYISYAEKIGWKVEMLNTRISGVGGIKEASVMIEGKGAYSRLKFESGTHRVQRVPDTESSGRIHTSTATIAILPEVDDVEVEIKANDLRIDVFRSSGNGGQSVNTTDSAVRITHNPTGLVVSCQDGKSQMKNKDQAMRVLKARLYEMKLSEQNKEIEEERRSQVGSGDRSAKIRTYNFPQGRITDHRVPVTVHRLEAFMSGEIDEMLDTVSTYFQAEMLKKINK